MVFRVIQTHTCAWVSNYGGVIPAGVRCFFEGGFRKERRGKKNVPCGTFNHNLKIFRGV